MQERHHEIQQAPSLDFRFAGMIDGYEMWMAEGANPVRFGTKTLYVLGVVGQMCREHLDGDLALQEQIAGPIDLSHPSNAYQLSQLIVAQLLSNQGSMPPTAVGRTTSRNGRLGPGSE
jgi:hypothetical protein